MNTLKLDKIRELVFEKLIFLFTLFSAAMVIFIFIFILQKASKVFLVNGLGFVTKTGFDTQIVNAFNALSSEPVWEFGALSLLVGSITTTLGALLISVPMGVGTAIVISEMSNGSIKKMILSIVRLLAGIPSIIFGLVGLIVVVPFAREKFMNVQMQIEYLEYFQLTGRSMLAGIIVLTFMIIPIITALSADAIKAVPHKYREASLALGLSKWRTIVK
ncbi:PstC family ABC transporter permease [Serpentinicella alkaliphila]|uniref:Binding-protein-dependent transport system inner membrane component n=1 Tax=Serpentinicella alkaliphila TaxID=1734049 RepID=A0A4R2TNC2_9FIRM|nr:ABC transporter permease subunit [Serpentinicella alkaliphila]QUH27091.1 ABC transporter permease subunit [Serpentinicella alkaliphila]TCQ05218.1 binding-protein-dependent transport system inner membrane component [Serpentinicella alkaliphila]